MNRTSVIIFIDWYTPAFKAGGPIKSETNIVNSLGDTHDFYIVTSDRDLGDNHPFKLLELDKWYSEKLYQVIYLSDRDRGKKIKEILLSIDSDFIYFNSLFSKEFTLVPLRKIKKLKIKSQVVLAPRGMLGPGALAIKPLKKKLFLYSSKIFGLFSDVMWHCTNEIEEQNIQNIFGTHVKSKIAGNISRFEINETANQKKPGELKLVFFSRVSPKKNIKFVIELLNEIKDKGISLDVFGPIEDEDYWESCNELISANNLKIKYRGTVLPKDVTKVLSAYHFFILPTHHENFGHVIVEALVSGCGLLLSDQTPWKNLDSKGIGWEIPLGEKNQWLKILNKCVEMAKSDYDVLRKKAYNFVREEVNDYKAIEETKAIFTKPIGASI